ncbi:TrkH family potassium uptake protein [Micromonospora sp. NPDC003197]
MASALRYPVRAVPLAFLGAIAVVTALLMLPAARAGPGSAPFLPALFTATSTVCVTGLNVADTLEYWSTFGHVIITVATQVGGYGIMTVAMLLALVVSQRLGLRNRLLLQTESGGLSLGDVRWVLLRGALIILFCESIIAVVLAGRLWLEYAYSPGRALWYGVFHAVQAFNNCGFALFEGSLTKFVGDAWICLPITFGVIAGSIGFPVLFDLQRWWRQPRHWSVQTRLTIGGSITLLVVGFLVMLAAEWANPDTLGPFDVPTKLLAAFVQGTMPRSGGFNSVDYGQLHDESIAITIGLMFIGGGSASTAGGIKVTTFFLLAFVLWAEIRGEPDVVVGRRRIATATQRQAITIALLGVAATAVGTLLMMAFTKDLLFRWAMFEVVAAFSTTGLTSGVTGKLPAEGQVLLIVLMYVGRLGTILAASALALNTRHRLYRYPEERPIVG